jgi:hypothetical protein
MKIGSAFSSKYLKQDHIGDKHVRVTIREVRVEEIEGEDGKRERKPVLYFQGKDMGMVLNFTNAGSLTDITGTDETDNWLGRSIVLYVDKTVMFGGKRVGGIRIAPDRSAPRPEPPPPPVDDFQASDDDVPF